MKKVLHANNCDVAYAMTVLGGKWKIAIIWKLVGRRLRYSQLRAALGSISEGVLINQLKELEKDNIISRIVYNEVPPHVEYELTSDGKQLEQALREIERWGAQRRLSVKEYKRTGVID
ncbi:MAG TPA: helix-turn-helix domain-containing protein [Candidatus Saccharimonadales bacterium]|nr:helix-turn-helix domain-containing protein [Candidatus Saccharimonadales bacterium]